MLTIILENERVAGAATNPEPVTCRVLLGYIGVL